MSSGAAGNGAADRAGADLAGLRRQALPVFEAWFGAEHNGAPGKAAHLPLRIALFALWLAAVLFMASRHVLWRDEVRALSLALQGSTVADMLTGLRGEGHPALWYLILRGLHALAPVPQVLPGAALAIGIAAMALLAFRAPFRAPVLALVMLGGFGLYEYVVMARNYGVTMLLLFCFAALYRRQQDRGWTLPALLFLLCQTNVHAVLLAGGLVLVMAIDLLGERGLTATLRHRVLIASALAVLLGALACYWEVAYPLQDAVHYASEPTGMAKVRALPRALLLPGSGFAPLAPAGPFQNVLVLSFLLWLALGGLAERPGLLLAGLGVQIAMCGLFTLVYPGAYRHGGLYLSFLLTLYWLSAHGVGGRWPVRLPDLTPLRRWGALAMITLLVLQLPVGLGHLRKAAQGQPESSSKALGALLAQPELKDAVVMADPDYAVEALPYYAQNPTYLPREQRFGNVVHFVSSARLSITLADLLGSARKVAAQTHRPVVILVTDPIETLTEPTVFNKGYVWSLRVTPQQARDFMAVTQRLRRFDGASTDENYTAWLLLPGR